MSTASHLIFLQPIWNAKFTGWYSMEFPLQELMTTPFDDPVCQDIIQIAIRKRSILSKHIRNMQFISQLDNRENKLNLCIHSFGH